MAIVYVKDTGKVLSPGGGTTLELSFGTLPAAGAHILISIGGYQPSGYDVTSVTDNQGNSYARAVASGLAAGLMRSLIYVAENIGTPSGTFTLTITNTQASGNYIAAIASEVSGLAASGAADQTATGTAADASLATAGPTGTTVQADELVFAAMQMASASTDIGVGPPASYTEVLVEQNAAMSDGHEVAYRILSATGTQTVIWTYGSSGQVGWSAALLTLKGAASGSVVPVVQRHYRARR